MAMPKLKDPMAGRVQVLKTVTCPSVSGKSQLTYNIGATEDQEAYIRISDNTGGGLFSKEWVKLKDVQDVIEDIPEGQPLTSYHLQGLFQGKSVNTPAFLTAALVHEKWLRVLKGRKRTLEVMDTEKFFEKVESLVNKGGKGRSASRKKAPARKAASVSRKKRPRAVRGS